MTMDAAGTEAEAVAVEDGQIVAVGNPERAAELAGTEVATIDCEGGVLLPAFIDSHMHLLSYAASLLAVDCRGARSIGEIQDAIRRRAAETDPGSWIRATGYEETALAEGRHPTAADLDAATADHPVRLAHSSGHARVLNSVGLRLAGISAATEEPPGGVISRDATTGEPDGLLTGMEDAVDAAVPDLPYEELRRGVGEASLNLLRAGVTCIVDATHTNGLGEWQLLERLMAGGALLQDVVMMEGYEHLRELPLRSVDGRLRRGPVKIMVHELENTSPDDAELAAMREAVAEVHAARRQAAIHAVGENAVLAAVEAIEAALAKQPRNDHRHRIEHCGVLADGVAGRIADAGIVVAAQPALLRERGDRYRALVPEAKLGRLYAFRELTEAGITLSGGSDAPVTRPVPLASMATAVERRTSAGEELAPEQAVGVFDALRWWTVGSAYSLRLEIERGSIGPGKAADLVLLPAGALDGAAGLDELRPSRIWQAGREVTLDST